MAALLSHCGANNGYVVTAYDQSGNGRNLTNATAASQPQIVSAGSLLTGANSKAEARFDGTNDRLVTSSWGLAAPFTVFMVTKQITWNQDYLLDGTSTNGIALTGLTSSPTIRILLNTSPATNLTNAGMVVGTPALLTAVWNTTSRLQVNANAEATGGDGTSRSPGGLSLGSAGNASLFFEMGCQELIVYAGEKNSTDRATARDDFREFYALW